MAAPYERAKTDPSALPKKVGFEQLEVAVKGDPKTGQCVPLAFSVHGGHLSKDVEQAETLDALSRRRNERVCGDPGVDERDFKVDLASDEPFESAVTVPGQLE